jgi:hypothetical protein
VQRKPLGPFTKRNRNASRDQERVFTGHGNVGSAGKYLAWLIYCLETIDLTRASLFCSGR